MQEENSSHASENEIKNASPEDQRDDDSTRLANRPEAATSKSNIPSVTPSLNEGETISGALGGANEPVDKPVDEADAQADLSWDPETISLPFALDHFLLEQVIGQGGFGQAFLARDLQIDRSVVLKLPRRFIGNRLKTKEDFIREARRTAQVNHPGIVQIYHVGEYLGRPYIVQPFIPGGTLREAMQGSQTDARKRVWLLQDKIEFVAKVADALSMAHQSGIVHRDLKPTNILINDLGDPVVIDFGLSIHESEQGDAEGQVVGTPAYMSPELARGESHLLNQRSDLWAIGVILYEWLAGRRPFVDQNPRELMNKIRNVSPVSLREVSSDIPKAIERICFRCLRKLPRERYADAAELAAELRWWIQSERENNALDQSTQNVIDEAKESSSNSQTNDLTSPGSIVKAQNESKGPSTQPLAKALSTPLHLSSRDYSDQLIITPRGLLPFGADDHAAYLKILPGPKNHTGYPDNVRKWIQWIHRVGSERTSAVGLVVGSSGCGKSSLIRAAIAPAVGTNIRFVIVNASAKETQRDAIAAIRQEFPDVPSSLRLVEIVAGLRRGQWNTERRRLVIVLDQFEQYLHSHDINIEDPIVSAIRQSDGDLIKSIILVRDDFFLSVAEFFREIDVEILEHQNLETLQLFKPDHAREVLDRFGIALGKWEEDKQRTRSNSTFLREAVNRLTVGDGIACARLSMFVETIRHDPWIPSTLRSLGTIDAIGTEFLRRTFDENRAGNPTYRSLGEVVARCLRCLLPADPSSNIKAPPQSIKQIAAVCKLSVEDGRFQQMLDVLDQRLKLITPVDRNKIDGETSDSANSYSELPHYQLTHDFLVDSIRGWLEDRDRRTPAGRAKIRLAELCSKWQPEQEKRFLPSTPEMASFVSNWGVLNPTETQKQFLKVACRFYAIRIALLFVVASATFAGFWKFRSDSNLRTANLLVDRLLQVDPPMVPPTIELLTQSSGLSSATINRALRKRFETSSIARDSYDSENSQRLSLSLLANQPNKNSNRVLSESLPQLEPHYLKLASQLLGEHKSDSITWLKTEFSSTSDPRSQAVFAFELLQLEEYDLFKLVLTNDQYRKGRIQLSRLIENHKFNDLQLQSIIEQDAIEKPKLVAEIVNSLMKRDRTDQSRLGVWESLMRLSCHDTPSKRLRSAWEGLAERWKLHMGDPSDSSKRPLLEPGDRDWSFLPEVGTMVRVSIQRLPPESRNWNYGWKPFQETPKPFWILNKELTYSDVKDYIKERPWLLVAWTGQNDFKSKMPALDFSPLRAIDLANWLSNRYQLKPYYHFDPKWDDAVQKKWTLSDWYDFLKLNPIQTDPNANGFRLPSLRQLAAACLGDVDATDFKLRYATREELDDFYELKRHERDGFSVVASKPPNANGIFDIFGNAGEYCQKVEEDGSIKKFYLPADNAISSPTSNKPSFVNDLDDIGSSHPYAAIRLVLPDHAFNQSKESR